MTMLHAVLTLERLGILPLHEAMKMVTPSEPGRVGIADHTGSLEVGKEADMVLVDYSDDFPRVLKTFVAGRRSLPHVEHRQQHQRGAGRRQPQGAAP